MMISKDNFSYDEIKLFLEKVDKTFPVPLSKKQNIETYASKLHDKSTICAVFENHEIVSMIAGYIENVIDDMAYISIVATLPEYYGMGYAHKLVEEFIDSCKKRKLRAVHLYAVASNIAAMKLYKKIGFVEYMIQNEVRPNDVHLIFYL